MKITIIKVAMFEGKSADALKPVFFEIANELLPQNAIADFIDDRKEALPKHIDSDIIMLSFDTFSAKRAYLLSKKLKTPNNLIVMGGFHPTVCPEEAKEHCDVVLLGDAEGVFSDFFKDYENKCVKALYDSRECSTQMIKLNKAKTSPYNSKYLPLGLVQFSRGCKFKCDFCSVKTMYPGKVVQKSVADTVEEIKGTKEKFVFFIDDNILLDEKSATELFNALKPLKKKWACQISLEIALNDKLIKLMKESGCICVLIGFESLNASNLKTMGKSANLLVKNYEIAIKKLHSYKLMIYGTFVIGYDEDDKSTAEYIMKFALKNNLAVANFNPLIPFPATPLYDRLKEENRLLYEGIWWNNNTYRYGDTAFKPAKMTAEELKTACKNARYEFYGVRSILKRFFSLHIKMGLVSAWYYLLINIVSGIEIRRKQGALLGDGKDN